MNVKVKQACKPCSASTWEVWSRRWGEFKGVLEEAVKDDLAGPSPCLAVDLLPKTRTVAAELAAQVLPWLPRLGCPAGGARPRAPRVSVASEDMLEA
eukprot:12072884-Alexandrium_andersonii.AAC.1